MYKGMAECEYCGREFKKRSVNHRFCSMICQKNSCKGLEEAKKARVPPPVMSIDEMAVRAKKEHCTYGKLQQKLYYESQTGKKHTGRSW